MTRRERAKAKVEAECAAWNQRWPVGTPVRYWTGERAGEGKLSVTRTVAQSMCGHASVWLKGVPGSIALSHVEPDAAFDPSRIRWTLRREYHPHQGTAWHAGLLLEVSGRRRPGATGDATTKDWRWWFAGSLTRNGRTVTTFAHGANSWQACRSWMNAKAAELFAQHREAQVAA